MYMCKIITGKKPSEYGMTSQHLPTILRNYVSAAFGIQTVVQWPCSEPATQLLHLYVLCIQCRQTLYFLLSILSNFIENGKNRISYTCPTTTGAELGGALGVAAPPPPQTPV